MKFALHIANRPISRKAHKRANLIIRCFIQNNPVTKRLPGMEKRTYHQRLCILELDSLELRRMRVV